MPDKNPVESLNKTFFTSLAWALWGVAALVISIIVVVRPNVSNSNCIMFTTISHSWWTGQDLYILGSIDGFLYFPQCAIIYTPFAALGNPIGGIAWRLVGMAIYCVGLWRLAKLLSPKNPALVFAFGSFAALAPTIASIRNGQANLQIAGFLLNVTVELARRRWSIATLYLLVALAVKPIIFVALLLAAAIYRPMRWRLALGLAIFLLVPFAMQNPHYVMAQYRLCASKLHLAVLPDRAFSDLRGIFWAVWVIPQNVLVVLQIIAAIATLALCLLASRWWQEPARSVFVAAFGACYLMLFNPRTEPNSYVILCAIFAIPAAALLLDDLRPFPGILLIVIGICFSCDAWAFRQTDHWLKPLTCAVLIVFLIVELFRRDPHRRRSAFAAAVNSAISSPA
jgi:uncharacterized membrane protein